MSVGLIILSFLSGSIPYGFLVSKIIGNIDIRKEGSGNIGATNVGRVMGWKYGALVLVLDILKGSIPTYLALYSFDLEIFQNPIHNAFLCGLASILGHVYSPFMKFKGGKGVATALGVCITLVPIPTIAALFVFFIVYKLSHYISLGSIVGSNILPLFYFLLYKWEFNREYSYLIQIVLVLLGFFIIYTHRENIIRLYKGEELLP